MANLITRPAQDDIDNSGSWLISPISSGKLCTVAPDTMGYTEKYMIGLLPYYS